MALYGYARVSTEDQDCSVQEAALAHAGCTVVRTEKRSGTSLKGRSELETVIDFIRAGDSLVITRIDRLARSVSDLEKIVAKLKEKGATLKATDQPIDTSSAAGTAFLQMLGVFAQFETAIRRERQLEGIARAKKEGVYRGRRKSIDRDKISALLSAGKSPTLIAKEMGIARASVYRLM